MAGQRKQGVQPLATTFIVAFLHPLHQLPHLLFHLSLLHMWPCEQSECSFMREKMSKVKRPYRHGYYEGIETVAIWLENILLGCVSCLPGNRLHRQTTDCLLHLPCQLLLCRTPMPLYTAWSSLRVAGYMALSKELRKQQVRQRWEHFDVHVPLKAALDM